MSCAVWRRRPMAVSRVVDPGPAAGGRAGGGARHPAADRHSSRGDGRRPRAVLSGVLCASLLAAAGALLPTAPAAAQGGSTIQVPADCPAGTPGQSLVDALQAAQDGNGSGECSGLPRGLSGPYTIVLDPADNPYVLTAVNNYSDGPDGLPAVIDPVTVESAVSGTPAVIERHSAQPFRFFDVAAPLSASCPSPAYAGSHQVLCPQYQTPADVTRGTTTVVPGPGGSLTLRGIELSGGLAQGGNGADGGGGGAGMGGAIFSHGGAVTLQGSVLLRNTAQGGAAEPPTADNQGGGGGMGGSGGAGYPSSTLSGGGGGQQGNGASATAGANGAGGGPNAGPAGHRGGYGGGGGGSALGADGGFGGGGGGGQYAEGGSGGFGGGAGAGGFDFPGFGGGSGSGDSVGDGGDGMGGGVFLLGGSLTVTDSTLSTDAAVGGSGLEKGAGYGGAIFVDSIVPGEYDGAVPVAVAGSTFTGDTAGSSGGAINVFGGSTTVANSTFSGDAATAGSGSALAIAAGALTVLHSAFDANGGGDAIGDYTQQSDFDGQSVTIAIADSTFAGNVGGAVLAKRTTGISSSGLYEYTVIPNVRITGSAFQKNSDSAIDNNGAAITVTGSTFTGNSGLCAQGSNPGGAITNAGTLSVSGATFSGNTACSAGGAIANAGALTVTASTFSGNSAGTDGGAISSSGGAASLTVTGSTFDANGAKVDGGAVAGDATLNMADSTFSGNSAGTDGGAISSSGSAASLTVSHSIFTTNQAKVDGGAVAGDATLNMVGSTFGGNTAGTDGGAISSSGSAARLTVTGSIFTTNQAQANGGAIAGDATLNTADSTFSGNSAGADGGAIDAAGSAGVYASTFSGNGGADGGAIVNRGALTVANTTFDANTARFTGGAIDNAGRLFVFGATLAAGRAADGGNLFGGGQLENTIVADATAGQNCSGGGVSGSYDLQFGDPSCGSTITGWLYGSPQLGPLQNNGGPTETMALGTGSAAIRLGDPTVCAAPPVNGLDQRGYPRPTSVCDIGAYEATPPSAADSPTAFYRVVPTPIAPPGSLAPGQTAAVTVDVETAAGAPAAYAPVYLSLTGAGSAAADGVALSSTPQLFTADGNGQVQITYAAGTPGPTGGQDVLTAAGVAGSGLAPVSDVYSYNPGLARISPPTGPVGTSVTLTGSGFGTVTGAVYFVQGSTTLKPAGAQVHWSAGSITTTVPTGLVGGGISVAVWNGSDGLKSNPLPFTVIGPPAITGVSPDYGPAAGGTKVTLTGTGFSIPSRTGFEEVHFGRQLAATVVYDSDSRIVATSPPGSGTVDITVVTAYGTNAKGAADQFTYVGAPTVTGLAPVAGPTAGGTAVTVRGTGFAAGGGSLVTGVSFGGTPAGGVRVLSATELVATSPAGAPGTVDVTVQTAYGTSAKGAADQFTYVAAPVVTGIRPAEGPAAGGTVVTVTGGGLAGATAVDFGATPASAFAVLSNHRLTATAPAGSGGVDVTVRTAGGTSALSAADRFTYLAAPVLSALDPNSGPVGTPVTLTGSGFGTVAGSVYWSQGGAALRETPPAADWTDGTISAPVPAGLAAGSVSVAVYDSGGQGSQALPFTVTVTVTPPPAAPVLSALTPNSGPVGTPVTLSGSGFGPVAGSVYWSQGGTALRETPPAADWTDGTITAPVPAGLTAGSVSVSVYGSAGQGSQALPFTVTVTAPPPPGAPVLSALDPNSGPVDTPLTLSGSGFGTVAGSVYWSQGGTALRETPPAADWTDGTITAPVPAGLAAGSVSVAVYGAGSGRMSNPLTFAVLAAPVVTGVSPAEGPAAGGTSVTITGSGFTGAAAVSFGGTPARGVSVLSDGRIVAVTPGGAPGAVDVTVTTPGGTSATGGADRFTYVPAPTVTGVSPSSGPVAGGTSVTISGTGFQLDGDSVVEAVRFGSAPAADFTVISGTQLSAVSPAGTAGTVDITVTSAGGTSAVAAGDRFSYLLPAPAAPHLASLSPQAGPVGTEVQLTGTGFGAGAGTVFWQQGSTERQTTPPVSAWSDGAVTSVVPSGLVAGTVNVSVENALTGLGSNALTFSVTVPSGVPTGTGGGGLPIPIPAPIPVTPSVGPAGGTLVTPDGACSATIPAGAVPQGETVTLSESSLPPSGIASGLVAASPVCVLGGAALQPPVSITLSYNAAVLGGRSAQRLSVYMQPSGGSGWTFAPTAIDSAAGMVSARTAGDASLVVLANPRVFPDVASGYWAAASIDDLLAADVIDGFPDGAFRPDAGLTRAQFTKMLVLTLGLPVGSGGTSFSDVPANSWFAPYVAAAVRAGIIVGTSATTFDPAGAVTREEMAVMLARALQLKQQTTLTFSDASQIDAWALPGVEAAVAAGYLRGFPDGTFQPQATTTRAQAAAVLARVIRHMAP